ncbi:MAG TPA: glycoside hydrolase family 25 protein [Candidatus Acidoferrum sp.]|nr:glycoside hydrolase family 25 protein [Candidatus Methylomirabilis sp.]HWU38713.1 glycoside hydrolase family 25 protein [Candidatus Acidoferrum sp.]
MINVVVDLSHHNGDVNLRAAKADGLVGVIHKATQGVDYSDPMYTRNRDLALAAGLLWGAYHFGVGGEPEAQADHFLTVVDPDPEDLLVLDLETNPSGLTMSLAEARTFLTRVQSQVGRWPGLYSGNYLQEQLGDRTDDVLAKCWLWLARYGEPPRVPANWPTWTMWQYTDGHLGEEPHAVAGIGPCDRDQFNGDLDGLRRLWGTSRPLA